MRPVGATHLPVISTALVAAVKLRASEKSISANDLYPQTGGDAPLETRSGKDRRKGASCQPGTLVSVPLRYSPGMPRLDAAFVAQLLGQIMPDRAQSPAHRLAAYEEPQSSARIFDTKL